MGIDHRLARADTGAKRWTGCRGSTPDSPQLCSRYLRITGSRWSGLKPKGPMPGL
jgi:hypothetical protein